MAIEYPDIISEYLVATERHEADGVQIVPQLEPPAIPVGGIASLVLFLQNAVDVPVELTLKPELPLTSRFMGSPMLAVGNAEYKVAMEAAQVGMLFVPMVTTPQAKEGQHQMQLSLSVKAQGQPTRIRASETKGRLRSELIDDVVGLDLARVVGIGYKTIPARKFSFPLAIRGRVEASDEEPDLSPRFEAVWGREDMEHQGKAMQEVSQRRAIIVDHLRLEPLFVGLFAEAQKRFGEAALPMRVGEAVAAGKILTYTVQHFLANSDLQDGLLVPMWELASRFDLPTVDPLWVLRNVGFRHLLQLSVALSFGVARKAVGYHPWTVEERRAVIRLVADSIEAAERLSPEFLYIPLLMAGARVSRQITLEGEDPTYSLKQLRKAKAARADAFADPELADANLIFDRLLAAALEG